MRKTRPSHHAVGSKELNITLWPAGAIKTVIDFTAFNAALLAFGLSVLPAHFVSVTLAILLSFIIQKTHVFGSGSRRMLAQASLFLLVTAAGMYVVQTGVIYVLVYVWQAPLELIHSGIAFLNLDAVASREIVFNNGAKVVATIGSMTWNYLLYRYIVFNEERNRIFDDIGDWFADHRHYVSLTGVLLLAAVFRFWQLDTVPPGLHPNEAADGLIATSVTEGDFTALYSSASGVLGAPFYLLQAFATVLLGKTALALRVTPALLGVLGVLFTYMAAHAWFSRRVAFVAAFLLASAPWAVHLSRISDYAVMIPVLVPLAMWTVVRAIRTNKALWYVATGLVLGGLWYSGIPVYVWIALAVILAVFSRRYYRDRLKYSGQPILIVLLSAVIAGIPLVVFDVLSGGVGRLQGAGSTVWTALQTPLDTAAMLVYKTVAALGMFHINGEQSILYNLPGAPLLNGAVGVLFVLGALLALRRFRDIRYTVLLAIGAGVFLVNLFGDKGAASAVGNAAMLPVVYILASIGLIELFARWRGVFPRNVVALQFSVIVILAVLGLATFHNWQHYFVAWANTSETYEAYHEHLHQTARYMNRKELPDDTVVIVDEESDSVLQYLVRTEYTPMTPHEGRAGVFESASTVIIPRYEATGNITLPDWNKANIHSPKRPNTVLYTVYTR